MLSLFPMAHSTYFYPNGPDNTDSAVKHSSVGYSLETPYGYHIDLDFLKYVDSIERANAIRRLSLQKRFGAANPISEPQGRPGPAHWTSSESLSSGSSDEVLRASFSSSSSSSSSMSHRRPPLPPSHSSPSLSAGHEASQPPVALQRGLEGKPPAAARSPALPRSNPLVERTLLETRRRLEQEKASVSSLTSAAPEPHPRRRLASFGGLGSSGSLSPYTSWKALNQSLQAGSAKLSVAEQPGQGVLSLGSASGGSLRHSPLSSGRATPVTGVSPLHLQMVRDQMMVALQRLKDLEEQVKAIPVLQVKISVLQEEKRQLVAQVKNLKGEETDAEASFRKRAHSTGSAEQLELQRSRLRKEKEPGPETAAEKQDSLTHVTTSGLKEFKQLTAEMQALEKKIKDARLETRHAGATKAPHARGLRSVAVGDDLPLDEIVILHQSSMKRTKDATTEVKLETRSAAVGVSESMLGASSAELELESQQHTIHGLRDQVQRLEAELKDMALQNEMGRLRHELKNAGARNHKSSTAQPLTHNAGSQAQAQTRSLGVTSHPYMQDASTGEQGQGEGWGVAVGVSCRPETRCVATGPDTPMERWSVREKVETCDKCVGDHVSLCSQSVCTETNVREAGVLTEETMETLSQWVRKVEQRTVGCGDCTVDVAVTPLRSLVSRGTLTEAVKGVDMGVMVTPCTVSQRTNTSVDSVSRFTSTTMAFVTESSTNTCLNATKEKHTNTMTNLTRTIAIGEGRVRDTEKSVRMRSIGVGTSAPVDNTPALPTLTKVATRDTGVGLANVHENYLVGLRTRNIACGPSRLPDPTKTRSIGIGVGEGRLRDASGHWQTLTTRTTQMTQTTGTEPQQSSGAQEPGLDHYIERMQRLLKEQQSLLSESQSELGQVMAPPQAHFTSISTQLASTLSCLDSAVRQTSPEETQPQHRGSEARPAGETTQKSPGRKKNPLGEKKSSDLLGPPSEMLSLKPIIKRKDGPQSCVDSRKKLKPAGLESMAMSEDSCSEDSDSDGAVEAPATSERRGGNSSSSSSSRPVAEDRKNRGRLDRRDRYELSEKTLSACHTLKAHLGDGQTLSSRELRSCLNALQQEWFRVSSQKAAKAGAVGDFLSAAHRVSPLVQSHVANMADGNGNTALHYSVSHSNFSVVKKLLDAGVCNVNQQNKAGYTPIMLAALAAVETKADMGVVEELFRKGDVNAKASQAGQTALMLAVSHGRMDMVRALLTSGSEVNIQDDEGSTALMCASEHGHADIVKLLLAQPGCDATLSDNDESTALSIALEAGHKDIAMLLYAHVNFSKAQTPGTPRLGHRLPQIQ